MSFERNGTLGWGADLNGEISDLSQLAPDLKAALELGVLPRDAAAARKQGTAVEQGGLNWLPPVPNPKRILCIGLNYVAHREETGRRPTEYPTIFTRYPSSIAGHGHTLLLPPESECFDFEGELAVVMGRQGRRIAQADALSHVAGYSCFMDGSIRDFQLHTGQYAPGKNFDRSGAFGPWLVSADEIHDPNGGHALVTRLNGDVVQQATTAQMIFPVPELISYISTFTTLEPGDVIATGTPGGVGFKRTPPLYLKDGDRLEVEIAGIGTLSNSISAEKV